MDLKLEGKKILVTGGSRGLGYACAQSLILEGAQVILNSRTPDHLKKAKENLQPKSKYEIGIIAADLGNLDELDHLFTSITNQYDHIDGLVLNAGGPPPGSALNTDLQQWYQAIDTNYLSAVKLCQAFLPKMIKQTYGRIVAITSTSIKQPIANLVLSNSVRLGLVGYLRTLANEVGKHNILVNTVCPGATQTKRLQNLMKSEAVVQNKTLSEIISQRTNRIPIQRFGEPHELGDLVTFLLSGRNTYITGQVIAIDGGATNIIF